MCLRKRESEWELRWRLSCIYPIFLCRRLQYTPSHHQNSSSFPIHSMHVLSCSSPPSSCTSSSYTCMRLGSSYTLACSRSHCDSNILHGIHGGGAWTLRWTTCRVVRNIARGSYTIHHSSTLTFHAMQREIITRMLEDTSHATSVNLGGQRSTK